MNTIPPVRSEFPSSLAYQQAVWAYLKDHLGAVLLTTKPNERDTPNVWALDRDDRRFDRASTFIKKHFPDHEVYDANLDQEEN